LGLAYDVYAFGLPALAALFIEAGIDPAEADRVQAAIAEQIEKLAAGQYPASLLERSRKMLRTRLLTTCDNLANLLGAHIRARLAGRNFSAQESLEQLKVIASGKISQLAKRLELRTSYLLTAARPEKGGES
jgi:predicted Zn-dependent peptidase